MTIIGDTILSDLAYIFELVTPLAKDAIQPNSIDVRLGEEIKLSNTPENFIYDMRNPHYDGIDYTSYDIKDCKGFVLPSKRFCLGVTLENIKVPGSLTATVEGRSGVGRTGLCVVNAGRVDTGWEGRLTLELYNSEEFDIMLFYGMPIAQIVYSTVKPVANLYGSPARNSKYQNDTRPEPSRMWRDYT